MDESREQIAARTLRFFRMQSLTQAEFGKLYGLGNQSNVGHYLHARRPISLDAALRFVAGLKAQGVKVEIRDISESLAAKQKKFALGVPTSSEPIKEGNKNNPAWAGKLTKGQRELQAAVLLYAGMLSDKQCHHIAEIIRGSLGAEPISQEKADTLRRNFDELRKSSKPVLI